MLLDRLAQPVGIGMERHEPFGLGAVAQAARDDPADDLFVGRLRGYVFRQLGEECESLDIVQQLVDAFAAASLVHELEELLEHARSCARGGNELDYTHFGRMLVVERFGCGELLIAQNGYAVRGGGRSYDRQEWKSVAEILDLLLDALCRKAVRFDAGYVVICKHRFEVLGFSFQN